ncbi:CybS-domain-containing protein [Gorgonomyces haynaldii]|nr:CybS-domain-containing protein [Gorgonomyces haynaldii]
MHLLLSRPLVRPLARFQTRCYSAVAEKSKVKGSYHWNLERGLSIVTVPLVGAAMVFGPIPLVDFGLALVIPAHTHLGIEQMVVDYIPVRKFGFIATLFHWALNIGTLLAIYGLYKFNTNDIGITAFVYRLWTGKKED